MPNLQELQQRFQADRFASIALGAEIMEAETGRAVCRVILRPDLMNANQVPMGGAIFTLADLAFAVAANGEKTSTVSQHISITFLSVAKGKELWAEAKCIKSGRSTCLYEVTVRDELDTQVAYATVNGFSTG